MGMAGIFLTGWIVLASAIILNLAADRLGITGWYAFLTALADSSRPLRSILRSLDIVWLFFLYPLALGLAARAGLALSVLLFHKQS